MGPSRASRPRSRELHGGPLGHDTATVARRVPATPAMERRRKPPIPLLCTSSHPLDHRTLDDDITPLHTMQGPITRARARQLDLQVRSNLVNCFSELTLGSMHVLVIRNLGEDQQELGEGQRGKEEKLGRLHEE